MNSFFYTSLKKLSNRITNSRPASTMQSIPTRNLLHKGRSSREQARWTQANGHHASPPALETDSTILFGINNIDYDNFHITVPNELRLEILEDNPFRIHTEDSVSTGTDSERSSRSTMNHRSNSNASSNDVFERVLRILDNSNGEDTTCIPANR